MGALQKARRRSSSSRPTGTGEGNLRVHCSVLSCSLCLSSCEDAPVISLGNSWQLAEWRLVSNRSLVPSMLSLPWCALDLRLLLC
jgi:hypothetical protein